MKQYKRVAAYVDLDAIEENFEAMKRNLAPGTKLAAVVKAKPAAAKGQYIRSCVIASTMGPGVKVSTAKY